MSAQLSVQEIKRLLENTRLSFRHQECATCECYLGYLTQLELDADPEGQQYLQDTYLPRDQVHSCLGCDPCPPGILYANYLRRRSRP